MFSEQKGMTKDDYVIVCGDFGIWDTSKEQRYALDWLNDKPFTTLFVAGNHSNYDLLKTFPVTKWNGGDAQFIRDSIVHLMRGQIFTLQGKRFFTMGGASSHDIQDGILSLDDPLFKIKKKRLDALGGMYRIEHVSWWKEELPSDEEYQTAVDNFEKSGWKVDYIITHCCPTSIQDIIGEELFQSDRLTDFFEDIKNRCEFENWLFGHYHQNQRVDERFVLLYEQIVELPV